MADYKPYPFLYKGVPTSSKITVSFYVSLPASEELDTPTETYVAATNTTTLTYPVKSGSSRSPVLTNREISWNGNPAIVKIVIETGGGGNLGSATVSSDKFD